MELDARDTRGVDRGSGGRTGDGGDGGSGNGLSTKRAQGRLVGLVAESVVLGRLLVCTVIVGLKMYRFRSCGRERKEEAETTTSVRAETDSR